MEFVYFNTIKDASKFLESDWFKSQLNKSVKITFSKPIKTSARGRQIKFFEFHDYLSTAGYCRIFWGLKDGTLIEFSRNSKPCQKSDVESGLVDMTTAPSQYFKIGAQALIEKIEKKSRKNGRWVDGLPSHFSDIT
jgi:hypothetical protein